MEPEKARDAEAKVKMEFGESGMTTQVSLSPTLGNPTIQQGQTEPADGSPQIQSSLAQTLPPPPSSSSRTIFAALLHLVRTNDRSGLRHLIKSNNKTLVVLRNGKDDSGSGLLAHAVVCGHMDMVALLLKLACDPNSANAYGWTPLTLAAYYGLTDCVGLLLRADTASATGDTGERDRGVGKADERPAFWGGVDGSTPTSPPSISLFHSALSPADPNATTALGFSPLMCAVANGHHDIVRLLCLGGRSGDNSVGTSAPTAGNSRSPPGSRDIDMDNNYIARSADGRGWPVGSLDSHNDPRAGRRLVSSSDQHHHRQTSNSHYHPPHAAINLRQTHGLGLTALMLAAHAGSLSACQFFINLHAEVNAQSKLNGWTPLMYGTAARNASVVRALLDAGADPGIANNSGETALEVAIHCEWAEGVDMLARAVGIDEEVLFRALEGAAGGSSGTSGDHSSLDSSGTSSFAGTVSFGAGGGGGGAGTGFGARALPASSTPLEQPPTPQRSSTSSHDVHTPANPLPIPSRHHRLTSAPPVPPIATNSFPSSQSANSPSLNPVSPVSPTSPSSPHAPRPFRPSAVLHKRRPSAGAFAGWDDTEVEAERSFLAGSGSGAGLGGKRTGSGGLSVGVERTGLLSRLASKFLFRSPRREMSSSPSASSATSSASVTGRHVPDRTTSPTPMTSGSTPVFALSLPAPVISSKNSPPPPFTNPFDTTTPSSTTTYSAATTLAGLAQAQAPNAPVSSFLTRDGSLATLGRLHNSGRPPGVYDDDGGAGGARGIAGWGSTLILLS
ncbi:Ankyrin repeat and SAM domain-containing protein 6 [Gonapodya sp. JEL0774]|nr:Ankyrin repeat and SAM domain-containing protein 6 [Gonapodya sp. JEL0774]